MTYSYQKMREKTFTEDGQVTFLSIRDRIKTLIAESECFTMGAAICNSTGDIWMMMACVERLVELGEIREVHLANPVREQNRIFEGFPT